MAASTRFDPQAKALGELLRARVVDLPAGLSTGPPGSAEPPADNAGPAGEVTP